jgi:hypothetical protein
MEEHSILRTFAADNGPGAALVAANVNARITVGGFMIFIVTRDVLVSSQPSAYLCVVAASDNIKNPVLHQNRKLGTLVALPIGNNRLPGIFKPIAAEAMAPRTEVGYSRPQAARRSALMRGEP